MNGARTSETQIRTALKAVRIPLRLVLPLAVGLCLLALAPAASADKLISEAGEGAGKTLNPQGLAVDFETGRLYVADSGNHRVDAFDKDGNFEMAFGWGVADGSAELQSCGPKATPPSATCRKGLVTGGAGAFANLSDIAVDNDPASPSHHDVYVVDERNSIGHYFRVQKFDPEGGFLLAFGSGVITGGAKGSGTLTAKSTQISAVQSTSKQFETGQVITGPGIPAETRIVAVGPGTITLSKAATASGAAVPISVAEGPGNESVNEIDRLVNLSGEPTLRVNTPDPSPSEAEAGRSLSHDATAAELQKAIEELPNVGPGNVKVTGDNVDGAIHEYTIEFTGTRFQDADVVLEAGGGLGNRQAFAIQNGGTGAEVCTAAIAASCTAGVEAGEAGGEGRLGQSVHIAIGPGGDVYLADCVPVSTHSDNSFSAHCKNRLQKFDPSGSVSEELALPQSQALPKSVAVDSSGDFYVSFNGDLRKYGPAGNPIGSLGFGAAIATDSADNLFVSGAERVAGSPLGAITAYTPALDPFLRFNYFMQGPAAIAPYQGSEGDLYLIDFNSDSVTYRSFPPPGPLLLQTSCKTSFLGNTRATLSAQVNPEGNATTAHFEYVDDQHFKDEGFANPQKSMDSPLPRWGVEVQREAEVAKVKKEVEEASGKAKEEKEAELKEAEEGLALAKSEAPFAMHEASAEIAVNPETTYHCRVIATNADGNATGEEGSFTSKEPLEFGSVSVSDVETEAATLNAQVNPLGITTEGFFEYVEEATYLKDIEALGPEHGFDHAVKAPTTEDLDFGSSEEFTTRSTEVSGLKPATSYRFRIIATNAFPPFTFNGPSGYLRTFGAGAEALPDQRAWELVSPGEKNSAEVAVPGPAGGLIEDARTIRLQAAAGSGEAITYSSFTSFANPESAPGTSQYLSKRTPAGWQTENISPFGQQAFPIVPPYRGFDAELGLAAFKVRQPALTPDCPEGVDDLYLRDSASGAIHCLTPESPASPPTCFLYAGASEDGSRAFFASDGVYAGAPNKGEFHYNLYEWSAAKGLELASILPASQGGGPAEPTGGTTFGPSLGKSFSSNCQISLTIMRHVVSADGRTAFWTYEPASGPTQLLARIGGEETIQLDAKYPSGKGGGEGSLLAASKDGSLAIFTAPGKLTADSKAAGQLYAYDTVERTLKDLTPGEVAPEIQGILGASDDASRVYFVAKGVLSGEEEGARGEKAEAGKFNLYLSDEGKTSFIARLSGEDLNDWETQPRVLSARVSPDGRNVDFLSVEAKALAGYDNTVAKGQHCLYQPVEKKMVGGPLCAQAFSYDAAADSLTCASCNPSGARPLGPTLLPPWGNPFEASRHLSDDGSRLFFESFDKLSLSDENERRDVYEFERAGSGTCDGQSSAFDPLSGGCHFLISGGKSSDETFLVDAGASGRDVFFSTRSVLTGWDTNGNYDVYDAREGGGFPEPSERPSCEGEVCKPPATAPPSLSSPVTPHTENQGNQPLPRQCRKGQVRRKGSCVKSRHKKARHHGKKRRAGR